MEQVEIIKQVVSEMLDLMTDVYAVEKNYDEPSDSYRLSLHYLKSDEPGYDKKLVDYLRHIEKMESDFDFVKVERAESTTYVFYIIVLL